MGMLLLCIADGVAVCTDRFCVRFLRVIAGLPAVRRRPRIGGLMNVLHTQSIDMAAGLVHRSSVTA
jgi:hypothetical protein